MRNTQSSVVWECHSFLVRKLGHTLLLPREHEKDEQHEGTKGKADLDVCAI